MPGEGDIGLMGVVVETVEVDLASVDSLIARACKAYTTLPERSLEMSNEALDLLKGMEGERIHTRAMRARGLALLYNGRHEEGMGCLSEALVAVEPSDIDLKVRVLHSISSGHHLKGALLEELYFAQLSLEEARKTPDRDLICHAQTAVSLAFAHCGDFTQSLVHCRQIVDYLQMLEVQRPTELAIALNNLGLALMEVGKPGEAIDCLHRALGCPGLPEIMRQAIMTGLGEVLHGIGRSEEAAKLLSDAADILARCGQSHAEADARMKLGSLMMGIHQPEGAIVQFKVVLEMAAAVGTRNYVVEAHEALSRAYKASGQLTEAIDHLEKCLHFTREVNTEASTKALAELRVQLEVSEAQHQAELSHLRNVELVAAHDELQQAHDALRLAEKARAVLLEKLEIQSRTDGLTGLANRRELDARLAVEVERSQRYGTPLSVSICDIDHFKLVNDRFGHAVGDEVIRALASILRTQCRELDTAARYGGEEFCLLLPQTPIEEAAHVCERIRSAVESYNWASIDPNLTVTLSMGLSSCTGCDGTENIVSAADVQLYRAKRSGRNRVCSDRELASHAES